MQILEAAVTVNALEYAANPTRATQRAHADMLDKLKMDAVNYAMETMRSDYVVKYRMRAYVATEDEFHEAVHKEATRLASMMGGLHVN